MKRLISKMIDKYKAFPVPVKASFFFVFCGVFKDLVDVIATPVFTRILTKEEYGLYSVYNSWYQIIRIIITLSIFSDAFNVGMSRYEDDRERFTSSQQGLITTLCLIWSAALLPFGGLLSDFSGLNIWLVALMLAQVFFSSAFYIWFQKKRYLYGYKVLTVVTVIYTLLQPLLGVLFIKINDSASFGFNNGNLRIIAGVGVQIAFGAAFFVLQFIKSRCYFNKEYWAFSLKMNIPLLPHFLSQILLNQSDRLMIDYFEGKSSAAIYSVAHSAAFVIQAVTTNLNATLVPWFYGKLKKKNYDGIRRTVTGLVILSAAVVFALVLIAPEAMKILAGKEYVEGTNIIPPLAFSVFLIFVYMLFSDVELFYGKTLYILISSIVGAASNIALNYIFIPRFGFVAAGYTTAAGFFLMCIGHIVFAVITCRSEKVPFSRIYDLKMICLIALVLAGLCTGVMFLYDYPIPRFSVLAVIVAVLIILRKKLIRMIKDLRSGKEDKNLKNERGADDAPTEE